MYVIFGGILFTLLWCTVIAVYVFGFADATTWSSPSKLGDFIAGVTAPIVLMWVSLAVLLQRRELSAQREQLRINGDALKLQADELRKTVAELERQTLAMEASYKLHAQNQMKLSFVALLDQYCMKLYLHFRDFANLLRQFGPSAEETPDIESIRDYIESGKNSDLVSFIIGALRHLSDNDCKKFLDTWKEADNEIRDDLFQKVSRISALCVQFERDLSPYISELDFDRNGELITYIRDVRSLQLEISKILDSCQNHENSN